MTYNDNKTVKKSNKLMMCMMMIRKLLYYFYQLELWLLSKYFCEKKYDILLC